MGLVEEASLQPFKAFLGKLQTVSLLVLWSSLSSFIERLLQPKPRVERYRPNSLEVEALTSSRNFSVFETSTIPFVPAFVAMPRRASCGYLPVLTSMPCLLNVPSDAISRTSGSVPVLLQTPTFRFAKSFR
ncbi:uncharacterized protein K460DRAFT_125227 [Cucurbitaria berberidis CBS 394.84]|uniref:Uncharacterized protein n=1 Tax=Cucurbitaria berberidis CBS 394.84 TaxID=1168544 RepID=A0A9P4GJ23_9PLEO|nr:uncharacterized protein K460DRAFT_125227 [Cucurbitaria berberidis CBS 394.84]KAF1846510.1 hypothetical protein K460DRAFT_125227 [Cucurbitaria berberidis CBS 394.84]